LLTQYFRELPEGLIPETHWSNILHLEDEPIFMEKITEMIEGLTVITKLVIFKFMSILSLIKNSSEINKMTSQNLAVCVAPNIFRFNVPEPTIAIPVGVAMDTIKKTHRALELMVENWQNIQKNITLKSPD